MKRIEEMKREEIDSVLLSDNQESISNLYYQDKDIERKMRALRYYEYVFAKNANLRDAHMQALQETTDLFHLRRSTLMIVLRRYSSIYRQVCLLRATLRKT